MKGKYYICGSSAKATALEQELIARGWTAADDKIDMLVMVPDTAPYKSAETIGSFTDWDGLEKAYVGLTGGFLNSFNDCLPRLAEGARIALATEKRSSTTMCEDVDDFGCHMGLATINMAMMALFNELYPKGYTFRAYAGDNMKFCAEYFERDRSLDEGSVKHSDEKKLTLRTDHGYDMAW